MWVYVSWPSNVLRFVLWGGAMQPFMAEVVVGLFVGICRVSVRDSRCMLMGLSWCMGHLDLDIYTNNRCIKIKIKN